MSLINNKLIIIALLGSSVVANDVTVSSDEWKINGKVNAYLQNINVVGRGDSTGRKGTTHNEELSINAQKKAFDGTLGVNVRVRGTNDKRIQRDGAELLYLRTFYKDKAWNLEAGDVASSLNPYVFSGTLKGAKVVYKDKGKKNVFDYTIIGGAIKPRWRDLYNGDADERATAYAGAFAIKYRYERAKELRLTLSAYKDDIASAGSAVEIDGKQGYSIGLDGKWRFNKYVTLKGYGAYNKGTKDIRRHHGPYQDSGAITLKLLTRPILRTLKSNFTYQRVSSKFISLGGVGASDKEQLENSTQWRINKRLKAQVDLKARRDNVDNPDLNATRHTYYERATLTYYPEFARRTTLQARFFNKDIRGRGADNNTHDAAIDITVRTKDGWRYGGGYEYTRFRDDAISPVKTTYTNNLNLMLAYKHSISKSRSYRLSCRTSYRSISSSQDTIGLKLDAGYTHNKKLSANLFYLLNTTDREVSNDTKNETYQFRATYRLDESGKNIVRLLLEKRDVNVDNTPSSSYDEYIQKVSLVMNF